MCKKYEPRLRYHVGFEFHSLSSLFFMNSLRKNNMPRILFCENPASQRMCLRKSWGIRTLVCSVRSFSKDVPCLHVILKYIHNVCICDVAILYMMTGNHLFLRKTCFLKNAGHKSLRLIAKWQLDNIYVEPLVCEEPGPGSSQTTACSLALLCASLWFA